ncbi:hypothetical protein NONO_c74090 [Nocardia nova SH22a]|uniref:Uncharacterized protein n=1 Tax=Nocardia nova SH22a TaxID=1415166 RepID=W5TSK2_9NOCA|nr:DUF5685 family protein [Nocardia nova]AHH22164.1 hypothetical protein NONO_c74090 [Nocardia nova SH22a]
MRPGTTGAELFGLLTPCGHSAAKYGLDAADWRTHMCGLCLGLRDGHGQLARAATNTDAIVLNVLTEAQSAAAPRRDEAGPCPLRGMQRATVAATDSPGVRLAATASLLLGAAKIRDRVDDGDAGPLTRRPMRRTSDRWFDSARACAARIDLDIEPLIAAVGRQTDIERAVELRGVPGTDADGLAALAELTEPTQLCAGELFAHSAVLAGRPENVSALRTTGWHFGRIAHLADAIEDIDADRRRGRFNPLIATGVSVEAAHGLLRESHSDIRRALRHTGVDRFPAIRWLLLDPLHGVVRKLGRTAGAGCADTSHRCGCGKGSGRTLSDTTDGVAAAQLLGFPSAPGHIRLSGADTPADERSAEAADGPVREDEPRHRGTHFTGIVQVPLAVGIGPSAELDSRARSGAIETVTLPQSQYPYRPDPYRGNPYPGPAPYQPGPGQPYQPGPAPAYQPGPYPSGPAPGQYPPGPGPNQPNPYGPQQDPYAAPYSDPGQQPYDIPPPFTDRPSTDPHPPGPPHEPPPEPPGFWKGIGIICGVYCTGYACCASHQRPCSGERRDSWASRSDCDCGDCCDCSDCGDCCSCCNCCSDCCDGCDCDCCGCDCSC